MKRKLVIDLLLRCRKTLFPDFTFEQGKIMKKNNVDALRKENDLLTTSYT